MQASRDLLQMKQQIGNMHSAAVQMPISRLLLAMVVECQLIPPDQMQELLQEADRAHA
jgi:hypothetical protein